MNPYGKLWRCKGSFLPQSDEPGLKHVTGPCKIPDLLRLDSTGEISSDDQRATMTGEKYRSKILSPTKCSEMKNLMNSTLFSWSKLSGRKEFGVAPSDSATKFENINDMARNMDKMAQEKTVKCPSSFHLGGTCGYSVPRHSSYTRPYENTFHNKLKGNFGFHPTMMSHNRGSHTRYIPKDSDIGRNCDNNRVPYTNSARNMYQHWKHSQRNWHNYSEDGCKNRRSKMHVEKEKNYERSGEKEAPQVANSKEKGTASKDTTMNSINMLKNILLQNEILNNSSCIHDSVDETRESVPSPLIESKQIELPEKVPGFQNSNETNAVENFHPPSSCVQNVDSDINCDNSENNGTDFPDWFSMGRSDSVDGSGVVYPLVSVCPAKIRSPDLECGGINHNEIENSEYEDSDTACLFQDQDTDHPVNCKASQQTLQNSSVPKLRVCESDGDSSQKEENLISTDINVKRSFSKNCVEKRKEEFSQKKDQQINQKEEDSISDSKDYSFVLFVRNNIKKCRPSAKKRRRSKARMQESENCELERTRHISVNIQNATQANTSNLMCNNVKNESEKQQETCSTNAVAFILGFDPMGDNSNRAGSHSFLVSFSDSETDSDFSSDEDEGTFSDEHLDCVQFPEFASPLNLNLICSVKKPEDSENSKLNELNLAWQINIQVKECKAKPNRKVHFADENKLAEIHPIIAWSYAYQAARKGPWEEYARDRQRFQKRIKEVEEIISPILQKDHRQQTYTRYFVE